MVLPLSENLHLHFEIIDVERNQLALLMMCCYIVRLFIALPLTISQTSFAWHIFESYTLTDSLSVNLKQHEYLNLYLFHRFCAQNFRIFGLINKRNSLIFGVKIDENYTIKLNFQIKFAL